MRVDSIPGGVGVEFQFQTGAIKSFCWALLWFSQFRFNSKLVRLKVHLRFGPNMKNSSFNSKLVRLKVRIREDVLEDLKSFQFQTGAIKSLRSWVTGSLLSSFNSKLVRLKVRPNLNFARSIASCFNSKLVRLKDGSTLYIPPGFTVFQFQTGAIKSRCLSIKMSALSVVSIPNWCD